jgi:hypothetical protein
MLERMDPWIEDGLGDGLALDEAALSGKVPREKCL